MKRILFLLIVVLIVAMPLIAEGDEITHKTAWSIVFSYDFPHQSGYGEEGFIWPSYGKIDLPSSFIPLNGDEGRSLGSDYGTPAAMVTIDHSVKIPFLTGDNGLTSGNNVTLKGGLDLTPVTLSGDFSITITPLAFLNFQIGGALGSGWTSVGIGPYDSATGNTPNQFFNGIMTKFWGSGTFNFDLGAIWKGDWTHLITSLKGHIQYRNYFGEVEQDAWTYLASSKNFNGWQYKGSYLIGYLMPKTPIDMIGIQFDTTQNLGTVEQLSTMASGGWGSDFIMVDISPMVKIPISEKSSLIFLCQVSCSPDYSDSTIFYNSFFNREYEDAYWRLSRGTIMFSSEL